jgi:hypothetical protein
LPDEEKAAGDQQKAKATPEPLEKPTVPPRPAADHVPQEGTPPAEKEKHPTKYDFRKWYLRFTAILVLIGAAYSFFSYQQWQALLDQIRIAKEQVRGTRLDERAWVGESEISGKVQEGQPFRITVVVKNTGKTFAKRYAGVTALRAKELSQPDPDFENILKEGSDVRTSGLIQPGGVIKMVLEAGNGMKMTKEHLEELNNPTNVMLVFGKLIYSDIFRCEHWTIFCYRVRSDGEFELYGNYNDADENECL